MGTPKKLVPLSSLEGRDHRFESFNKDNLLHCNKILNCKKNLRVIIFSISNEISFSQNIYVKKLIYFLIVQKQSNEDLCILKF